MRFRVRHLARYRYDAPIALGPHVLRLTPRGAEGMAHGIRVTPEPASRTEETDRNGNRVSRLTFAGKTNRLEIEARFELDTARIARDRSPPGPATSLALADVSPAVAQTAARLSALAGRDPAGFAESLAATLYGSVTLDRADTSPLRTPGDTLARGRGSARDIAALYVDLSRRAGLPARFVAGYWAESVSASAPRGAHFWPEVFVEGQGWLGFDPTTGGPAGENHLPMAAAADLAGTRPVMGSTYGAAIPVRAEFELNVLTRA